MNIIISPAKKMNINNDDLLFETMPVFLDKTKEIYNKLMTLSFDELKALWQCNDDIAKLNFDRYKNMNLNQNLSPAILAYEGIQYKYMSPSIFETNQYSYIQKHLKILSGFYGILKPFDGVVPYRLEMQSKLSIDNHKNLYDFYGEAIYTELTKDSNIILNLASKEYSKVIEKHLKTTDTYITCVFGELVNNKIKVKATDAKMTRGLMVKYLAENNITNVNDVKNFSENFYKYSEVHSTNKEFVFIK